MIRKIFFLSISFFQFTCAQAAPIYVDSADVFHQIPSIQNDVYSYLKNIPLTFEKHALSLFVMVNLQAIKKKVRPVEL